MRKATLLVTLLLVILLVMPAHGQKETLLRDSTAVLSAQTVEALRELNQELQDKTGYRLAVDLRHFLGGIEADAYARQLLEQEETPSKTLLLLAVVGEERYAAAMGKDIQRALGEEAVNSLLSMRFRGPFQDRDYDGAVLTFAREAARQLALHAGTSLRAAPVEVQPTSAPTPAPTREYTSIKLPDLNSVLREPLRPTEDPAPGRERTDREERGMSIGSIIVMGLVLSALFGGKKGRRGCGCGPLGWILGVFGVSKMFGWRK